jgi:hypothetical protein
MTRLKKRQKRPEFTDEDCRRVISEIKLRKAIEDAIILRAQLQDILALNMAQKEPK